MIKLSLFKKVAQTQRLWLFTGTDKNMKIVRLTLPILFFILILPLCFSMDQYLQGDLTGLNFYKIYEITNVSADDFYQDGFRVLDVSDINGTTFNYTLFANYSEYSGTASVWNVYADASDLNNLILVTWDNVSGTPSVLSFFTDDLGDRGYTHLTNFSDDLGNRGFTHLSNFSDDIDYSTKNVNYSEDSGKLEGRNTTGLAAYLELTYGWITNSVNDLVNYYTKTQVYNQSEIDDMLAGVLMGTVNRSQVVNNWAPCPVGSVQYHENETGRYCDSSFINSTEIQDYALITYVDSLGNWSADKSDYVTNVGYNKSSWDTAYGWGNHDSVGYLTSYTETDPVWLSEKNNYYTKIEVYNKSEIDDAGYVTGTPWTAEGYITDYTVTSNDVTQHQSDINITESQIIDLKSYLTSETDPIFTNHVSSDITITNITNWNTAYLWGNHALIGYVTGTPWTEVGYLVSSDLNNYYIKPEVYNKTESDNRYLQSYTETDPIWLSEKNNYYTKLEVYNKTEVYSKTEINNLQVSHFNNDVGYVTDTVSSMDIADIKTDIIYMGDRNTDGSWRVKVVGGDLVFEKRESGTWTEKIKFE